MSELIHAYQSLFLNRHSTMIIETFAQLEESIQIELLDKLTHPRVRKKPEQKLMIAYERIEKSELNQHVKQQLIRLYETVYQNVNSF
jgi:hypothetical protein